MAGRSGAGAAYRLAIYKLAPGLGLEPRFTASKAAVLPLDDPGSGGAYQISFQPSTIGTVRVVV